MGGTGQQKSTIVLKKRNPSMKTLEEIYGPFGTAVVNEIRKEIEAKGGLESLLTRLNLPVSSSLVSQHEVLKAFIFQYGIAFFLKVIQSHMTPQEVEAAKGALLAKRLMGDTRSRLAARSKDTAASSPAPPSPPSPCSTTSPTEDHAAEGKTKKIIVTPTYVGPDRRSGRDRRKTSWDRRMRVEIIFKNQRFGGRDRRKFARRQEDREK
jgi:hypothetical protein